MIIYSRNGVLVFITLVSMRTIRVVFRAFYTVRYILVDDAKEWNLMFEKYPAVLSVIRKVTHRY